MSLANVWIGSGHYKETVCCLMVLTPGSALCALSKGHMKVVQRISTGFPSLQFNPATPSVFCIVWDMTVGNGSS